MAYNTKSANVEYNGIPIFQLYNPTTDSYEIIYGNGSNALPIFVPVIKEYIEASTTTNKTYTNPVCSIAIYNDGASDLTLTINSSVVATVKSGEYFDERFSPFTAFTITATTAFRCWVRG